MAGQKNQTNGQILKDILQELKSMNSRVSTLENWKIAEDAARSAIAEYKREERTRGGAKETQSDSWLNKELFKALGLALSAILALVAIVKK